MTRQPHQGDNVSLTRAASCSSTTSPHPRAPLCHSDDNLTGEGGAEQITVNLAALPAEADKIVFPVFDL